MSKLHQITVVAVLIASSAAGFAAPELSECVKIEAPSQRLLCYDQYAGRSSKAVAFPAQTPTGKPEAVLPPSESQPARADRTVRSDDDFETDTVTDAASFGLRKEREWVSKSDYITAKIVSTQSSPSGAQIMSLSNGQIWIENEKGRRPIELHQTVTIRRQRFHYKMVLESQPDVAVRRLQ
jgi:hypothetical protein